MVTSCARALGLSKEKTICLGLIALGLVGNLFGIAFIYRPTAKPESYEEALNRAKECFESGHDVYSIKEGCK